MLWAATPSDSTTAAASIFTQLGTAGAVAAVLGLWQRDTAKQRDRLLAAQETQGPVLIEIRDAMRAHAEAQRSSAEAQRAAAEAITAVSAALNRIPSEGEVTRLRDALRAAERRLQERASGRDDTP